MKRIFYVLFVALAIVVINGNSANAQEFNIVADVQSRYIWRGTDYGNSPSIQPSLSYTYKGFEIGYWGAYSTTMNYQETDLYLSYTIKDIVSIGVTDYFFPMGDSSSIKNRYFDYSDETTGHVFEANLSFNGTDKIPVYLSVNYNFYGADKDNSFYAEVGYNGSIKDVEYSVFAGATSGQGIYMPDGSDGFSVVNLGLSVSKDVKITDKWSLPISSSLIFNPQAENVFLVFGFSL